VRLEEYLKLVHLEAEDQEGGATAAVTQFIG